MNFLKNIFWLFRVGFKNVKIRFFSFFKKDYNDPYRLLIKVNNSCNYQCATCGIWKNDQNTFLNKEKQREIINNYKNQLFFLSITGGEPFLDHQKLINFLKHIKSVNPNLRYISINTNCSFPTKMKKVVQDLLNKFPELTIYVGLHYIPDKKWGAAKTGVENAYSNYKETEKVATNLEQKYKGNFSFYKMITVSQRGDIKKIKKVKNLWLNFATVNKFYNNSKNEYIEDLNNEEKINIINTFLEKNKKNISLLNKYHLYNLKKILQRGRKRKCFAGISRSYINHNGKEFICSRKLKTREDMTKNQCKDCWTPCESNFDLVPHFFLPAIVNNHKKSF